MSTSKKRRPQPAHDHICPSCGYTWHHKERRSGAGIVNCPYPEATYCSIDCRIVGTPKTQAVYVPMLGAASTYTPISGGDWSVIRRTTKLRGAD